MQQTNEKGPAVGPAREILKVSKSVGGGVSAVLGQSQQTDDDGDQSDTGPINGKSLREKILMLVKGPHKMGKK